MQHRGLGSLRSPVSLLGKIIRDCKRIKAAPTDSDAAFDFFTTACHMHEWWQRYGVEWTPPTDAREAAIFRLCGEVGNGAKHFVMERKHIVGHEIRWGSESAMVLHLEDDDAALFGVASVTTLQLAASVVKYWSDYEYRRRFPLSFT